MDWTWYLFRFEGRINRAKMWLAGLIIGCWMVFLAALVIGVGSLFGELVSFGFGIDDLFKIVDPATYRSLSSTDLPTLFIKLVGSSLFLWVYFAASIKRLHDRDRSGWWMVPFFILPGLYSQFEDRLPDSYWMLPLAVASGVLCLWGFIEMCCLRGTPRTNRFGPDPLPKVQTRPRSSAGRTPRATPAWDQHSELEFEPHRAGRPAR